MGCLHSSLFTHVNDRITSSQRTQYPECVKDMTFADWFRNELRRREWTQAEFARRAKMAPSTVSTWTSGDRIPDPDSCDLIADVLLRDLDEVLEAAGHRPPSYELPPGDPRRTAIALIRQLDPDDPATRFWLEMIPGTVEKLRKLDKERGH